MTSVPTCPECDRPMTKDLDLGPDRWFCDNGHRPVVFLPDTEGVKMTLPTEDADSNKETDDV